MGTGFHPELTGRENIYLNGAILGMSRVEIKRKFDEIVAFAEIERFLDTPVKRYSSGMYVRLAFAVAAHLEPEILIIDEVLAVGDQQFQNKCLGKMKDVSSREGRTVIFVSHNLGVVANLCSRAVLLDKGRVAAVGPTSQVIEKYMEAGRESQGERVWSGTEKHPATPNVRMLAVRIIGDGEVKPDVSIDRPIHFELDYEVLTPGMEFSTSFQIVHPVAGEILASANFPSASLTKDDWFGRKYPKGVFRSRCSLPGNLLNEGRFSLNVAIMKSVRDTELFEAGALQFFAQDTGGMRGEYTGQWIGVIRPRLEWQTELLSSNGKNPV